LRSVAIDPTRSLDDPAGSGDGKRVAAVARPGSDGAPGAEASRSDLSPTGTALGLARRRGQVARYAAAIVGPSAPGSTGTLVL
jgi:hypothetical protein